MFTEFVFIIITAVILYSLTVSTEKALTNRQSYTDKDARILDHRSRL